MSRRVPKNAVTFAVPNDYTPPDWYATAPPESVAEALTLGATLFNTVRAIKSSEAIAEIEAEKAQEIARIRAAAAEQIATVQADLAAAHAAERARLNESHAARLLEAQDTARAAQERAAETHAARLLEIQERCAALQERRRALEEERDVDIRIAEERTRVLLQHTLDEKERAILRAEKMLATLQEAYTHQSDELRALADLIRRKPTNVKTKGNDYEIIFREKLIAAYGTAANFSVTHDARGHAGDWLMTLEDHTILWEVKDYDKPVPAIEVEKFMRDMRENTHVRIGVMVSRFQPITGKNAGGDRIVEFNDGKMTIYLSNYENMSDDTLVQLLLLFRVYWSHDKTDAVDESKQVALRQVIALHEAAARAKTEWRLHKSRMDDAVRWMAEMVEHTEERLKAALAILQGTSVALEVPAGVFREVAGDDRASRDVQIILKYANVSEGSSLLLNELADAFSKECGISRETAKSHIRAVVLDSCIDSPKGKPTRIVGLQMTPLPIVTHF
jgi:hypothetical protein